MDFKDITPTEKAKEKTKFAHILGESLREARIGKGLSQEQLADKAGFYRTYVGHIETGKYSPSVHTVWRLAKAMDTDLSELLKDI